MKTLLTQIKEEKAALVIEIDNKETLVDEKQQARQQLLLTLARLENYENDEETSKAHILLAYQAGKGSVPNFLDRDEIDRDIQEIKSIQEFSKIIYTEENKKNCSINGNWRRKKGQCS